MVIIIDSERQPARSEGRCASGVWRGPGIVSQPVASRCLIRFDRVLSGKRRVLGEALSLTDAGT